MAIGRLIGISGNDLAAKYRILLSMKLGLFTKANVLKNLLSNGRMSIEYHYLMKRGLYLCGSPWTSIEYIE